MKLAGGIAGVLYLYAKQKTYGVHIFMRTVSHKRKLIQEYSDQLTFNQLLNGIKLSYSQ